MSSRRGRALGAALLLAGAALPAMPVRAAGRVQCGAVSSAVLKRPVRYCALLPPRYDADPKRRYPVLYYLHGLGENEQSLVNFGGWNLVEELQARGRIGEFLIVTPDGGSSFYINARDRGERYEDFFVREFIPAVDRTFRTRAARAYRGIGGTSMGGYGALRLAFKYPERFASVSAHSAALVENPARGFSATLAPLLARLTRAFGVPPDEAYWQEQSPFTLARQKAGLRRLRIYLDCGIEDEYGFEEGARALHRLLRARRVAHEFHLYPGGHGWLYVAEHLHATLEFHAQTFGLGPTPEKKKAGEPR